MQNEIKAAEAETKANAEKPQTLKALVATSGAEWRKMRTDGILVELPSGFVARLRPVGLIALSSLGKIPSNLMPIAAELVTRDRVDPDNAVKHAMESMSAIAGLYDVVCKECFLSPRVVDDPKADDEISLMDISDEDKQYVMAVVNAPSHALIRFRDEQTSAVQPVPNGEGLRAEAEHAA